MHSHPWDRADGAACVVGAPLCGGSMWPWLSLNLGALPTDSLPAPSQARSW